MTTETIAASVEVTAQGHYVVKWGRIQADFYRLRWLDGAQFGGLNGEVSITTNLPGVSQLLYEARINLSSTSGRKSLFDVLKRRLNPQNGEAAMGIPAIEDFVETACILTIRKFREGKALINLAGYPYEAPQFSIASLFPLNKRAQLYAPAEHFKTTLMLAFLMDVVTGQPSLGFDVRQSAVAYLDWETDENDASNIWTRLAWGRGLTTVPDLWYQRLHRPIWDEAEALAPQFARDGVKFALLDSAFWACGQNPNDQDKVGMMFQGIDTLGEITSVLLNHTRAGQEDVKRRRHYGLEHFRNAVRASWEIRKASAVPGDDCIHLGLYRDKLNMRRDDGRPYGFRVKFDGDAGPITIVRDDDDVDKTPELNEAKADVWRVNDYIKANGRVTAEQIMGDLGIPQSSLYKHIARLKATVGKTTENGKAVYFPLTARREPESWC